MKTHPGTYSRYVIVAKTDYYSATRLRHRFLGATPLGASRHATRWIVDDNYRYGYEFDDACNAIADMAEKRGCTLECDYSFEDDVVTYSVEMIGDIVDDLKINIYGTYVVMEHGDVDKEMFRGTIEECEKWMYENTYEHPWNEGEMISCYDDNVIEETGERYTYTIEEL